MIDRHATYDDHHKHWADAAFQEPKKEPLRIEGLVILTDHGQDETDTPDCNTARSNSFDRISLGKHHGRISSHNETKVED